MVSTRSGKRTSTSGPRTRSQGRSGGSGRRRRSTIVSARNRVEVVVRFGPRKGKKTTSSCLKAGRKLKTTGGSDWGKKLRKCRTNKIA